MVAIWAWPSPLLAGVVIGGTAWMCVTGFDVHRFGEIGITGSEDAVRAVVLVLAGVLAASIHAMADTLPVLDSLHTARRRDRDQAGGFPYIREGTE